MKLRVIERVVYALMFFVAGMLVGAFLQWDSGMFFEGLDKPDVGYTEGGA